MPQQQNELLLVAFVPAPLKDKLVDVLMSDESLSGFSLTEIQGFSRAHSQYSVSEQVEGYQDFFRFEVSHAGSHTQILLSAISEISPAKKVRYWLLPLIETGVV